ncbi:MAG: HypC/HybG/HupF family hydrogenase formation chaperone [Gemmatimonadota bacterium]|jgi:hydrogenase expression/formation protein HypC
MCLGIPGMIVEVGEDGELPMGVVDFGGVRREVCLAYVADEATVGDYVIVHVGFAIAKIAAEEAQRTFRLLEEMGETGFLDGESEAAPPDAPSPDEDQGDLPGPRP